MKIHINSPCHENWDGMSPQDKGRHCQQCDKVVTDFTTMDNFGILKHLHQETNACGRFSNEQLQKELELPKLQNPWLPPFRKIAFGSMLFGKLALAQTDTTEVSHEPQMVLHQAADSLQKSFTIKGKIVQPKEKEKQAISLHFELDSFAITLPLDSQYYSFEVPGGLSQKQVKIGVTTADSFYQLAPMSLAFVSEGICEITIEYTDIWTSNVEPPQLCFKINTTDWGWGRDLIATTMIVTTGSVTTGEYSLPEEMPVEGHLFDTNLRLVAKQKEAFKKLVIHEKRQSSRWWWLLPGFIVFAVGAWQWKRSEL